MSSAKSNKKWKDQVTEDFLRRSKITEGSICKFQDQITFASNPNDVPLRRERKFEKTVYKISKIDKKNNKPSSKKEVNTENLTVTPDKCEILAEIDKHLRHLEGQKKFLQMAKDSQCNKTWGEQLRKNQTAKSKNHCSQRVYAEEYPKRCDSNTEDVCAFFQKLLKKNCIKVADSCTQIESPIKNRTYYCEPQCGNNQNYCYPTSDCSSVNVERRGRKNGCVPIKMVDSGTQINTCSRCPKHQSTSKKGDRLRTDGYTACGVLDFLNRSRPSSTSRVEDNCTDESEDRFKTTYMRSYNPPNCSKQRDSRMERESKTRVIYPKSTKKLPSFLVEEQGQRRDLKTKNKRPAPSGTSPRTSFKTYTRSPRINSVEKDLNRMPYKPTRFTEEVRNLDLMKNDRRKLQKTPRLKASNKLSPSSSPPKTPRYTQVSPSTATTSARSTQSPRQIYKNSDPKYLRPPDSQASLYAQRKVTKSRKVTHLTDFDISSTQQSPRQRVRISEREKRVEQTRQAVYHHGLHGTHEHRNWDSEVEILPSKTEHKNRDDEIDLTQRTRSRSPTNNLSAAKSSTPQRSLNVISPNVIDDSTYTRPESTNNDDYVILPYVPRTNDEKYPAVPPLKLDPDIQESPKNVIDKSAVTLEDVSSRESQWYVSKPAHLNQNDNKYLSIESKPCPHINDSLSPSPEPQRSHAVSTPSHTLETKFEPSCSSKNSNPELSHSPRVKNINLQKTEKECAKSKFFQQMAEGRNSQQSPPTAVSSETNISTSNFKEVRAQKSDLGLKSCAEVSENNALTSNTYQSFKDNLNESLDRSSPPKTGEQTFVKSEIDSLMPTESEDGVFLSETQNENKPIQGVDSELQNFIQYLQNRLRDCDAMVSKQLEKYEQERKEMCQNVQVCKLEPQSTYQDGDPEENNNHPQCSIKRDTGAGGECLLISQHEELGELALNSDDHISDSELEFDISCNCHCEEDNLTSTRSEIAPFSGCECMREGYYKIMQLVYNNL